MVRVVRNESEGEVSYYRIAGGGRRDSAEPGVKDAFEAGGADVAQLSGKDIPDLLVGYLGVNHAVEVKTNNAKLREGQRRWHQEWSGERPVVARTPAQARKWLRKWADEAKRTHATIEDALAEGTG